MPDTELWREVPDYPNYEVSSYGRIRNVSRGNILQHCKGDAPNFYRVALWREGVPKYIGVHRIVAKAFLPDYRDYRQVKMIDPTKGARVDNLVMTPRGVRQSDVSWGETSEAYKPNRPTY